MILRLIERADFLSRIDAYFFPPGEHPGKTPERFGVIFISTGKTRKMTTLIPAQLWLPEEKDYDWQTRAGLRMTDAFVNRYYTHCRENGYSLMTIHSHPFDHSDENFFSGTDDSSDEAQRRFFNILMPGGFFAAGVMNRTRNITYRVFGNQKTPDEILHVDFPLRKSLSGQPERENDSTAVYDRQIRVFGKDGQRMMGALRVCIIGVGGLGSVLVEVLARLGVNDFTLIDPDRAEWTNLNRFTGMYRKDVEKNRFKVHIARRLIKKINPDARVRCVETEVYAPRAVNAMKEADVVFLGTDNATSRHFVNMFCLQYLVPCISMGSVVSFSQKMKKIMGILGEVIVMLPGSSREKFCLICSGAVDTDLLKLENMDDERAGRILGYVQGDNEPAPAVRYLNGLVVNLAASEFHNLICHFKRFMPYQRINLIPSTVIHDDFDEEDFDHFLAYLKENKIILKNTKGLRNALLKGFTVLNEDKTIRSLGTSISVEKLNELAGKFHKKGVITAEMKSEFVMEVQQYFTAGEYAENNIVSSVNVARQADNCHVCGKKAMVMGEGDLMPLKKFTI